MYSQLTIKANNGQSFLDGSRMELEIPHQPDRYLDCK